MVLIILLAGGGKIIWLIGHAAQSIDNCPLLKDKFDYNYRIRLDPAPKHTLNS